MRRRYLRIGIQLAVLLCLAPATQPARADNRLLQLTSVDPHLEPGLRFIPAHVQKPTVVAQPVGRVAQVPPALKKVTIRGCYDGDTCTTATGEKIRLACIDTPELRGKQAEPERAQAARDYLRRMVVGKEVGIRRIAKDRYGRTVAELYLNGSNVQQKLVASGHAEIYWKYAKQCPWTR